jgi:hypothetical protein
MLLPGPAMWLRRLFPGILLVGVAAGVTLFNNNWSIGTISRAEFLGRLDHSAAASRDWIVDQGRGTGVLLTERPAVLLGNAALMHMVADCARASGDEGLQSLVGLYFTKNAKPYTFGRLVDPDCRFERPPAGSWNPDDYQAWFLHAVAPAEFPLPAESLAKMFSPDKFRTGRATHQLFALYLYRKHNGATPELDRLIRRISQRIASEAAVDFRVTDLYLQRIAFLLAAGQTDLVKRRWVERALAAQQADGGWLWSWFGWQPSFYRFRFPDANSTTHPTAQGMWIACMLKYRYGDWVERNYP